MSIQTVMVNDLEHSRPSPHFTAADIARVLDYRSLIDQIAGGTRRAPAAAPVRICVKGGQGLELLVMPSVSARYAGTKILTILPSNGERGLRAIGGIFVLFDAETGATLATMDAGELTARRTAAVSALASEHLSRSDAATLLLLGSGHLVPYLAEAHAVVRPIRGIRVWARNLGKAEACVARIATLMPEHDVRATGDLDRAVGEADIISAATRANGPLVKGELLRPGVHIDAVGGYRPDMREVDDDAVRRARLFVDNREAALAEAGDLISPLERGIIGTDAILGDLAAIVGGEIRTGAEEITLFKSVGSADTDLAAAALIWERRHA